MSFDFIDAASEQLQKQEYPFAIICGSHNGTLFHLACSPEAQELMAQELRSFADDLENGEYREGGQFYNKRL